MEFNFQVHTYASFGGQMTISLVGDYLMMNSPTFGAAITEFEIHSYFRSTRKPRKTLESTYDQFHRFCENLPKVNFLRKKMRIVVQFASKAATAEDIDRRKAHSLDLFRAIFLEFVQQMDGVKTKLGPRDDFDVAAFERWLGQKRAAMPTTEAELTELSQNADAFRKARYAAMDEWEKLGIDWIDYHPKAREVLNSPFYWSCGDDFAPNGNDTGADVLSYFREWRTRNTRESSKVFFEQLLEDWGVKPAGDDEFSVTSFDESAIGLAFAHLKLDAACPNWIKETAISSLKRQRQILIEKHRKWDLFQERSKTLDMLEQKLLGAPVLLESAAPLDEFSS